MFQLSGLASGLDTGALVESIVQNERAPRQSSLQRQQFADTTELSALGKLQAAINDFSDAVDGLGESEVFNDRQVVVSNSSALDVTVSDSAVTGTYLFTVQQLATNHQQATAAFDDSATFGSGSLVLTANGESMAVALDSGNNTLEGVRDAINSAVDNLGVSATIINDNGQQRLLLNGTQSGVDYAVTVDTSGLALAAGDSDLSAGLTELQAATNARIVIGDPDNPNSIAVESSSNSVAGVIDGVTLNLKEVSTTPVTVDISLDKAGSEETVKEFVGAYNELMTTMNNLTRYSEAAGGAALTGDASVRSLASSLRSALGDSIAIDGQNLSLTEFGIRTSNDGTFTVDDSALSDAVSKNFSALQNFFSADNGLGNKLSSVLSRYDDGDGILKGRMDRLDEGLRDVSRELEELDVRMETVRKYWEGKFLAMEQALSQLNSTSSWLGNNLGSSNSSSGS